MDSAIYTYALMHTLYDDGQDYIDSFWPLVIRVVPEDRFVTLSSIQREAKRSLSIDIPIHVIGIMMLRAENKALVEKQMKFYGKDKATFEDEYKLTKYGSKYISELETNKEVERRINKLVVSIETFLIKKGINKNEKEIKDLLLFFINSNINYFATYINSNSTEEKTNLPTTTNGSEAALVEYIDLVDKEEPDNFRTLQDLVMGSIISVLLQAHDTEGIKKFIGGEFKKCKLYLDTNFVFSVFELHDKVFSEPAIELLNLLKENNFELRVFSFTLDEINDVIDGYCTEGYRYPSNVKVATLYSALKRKQWTKTQAREFIMHIESNLADLGITVEWFEGINLKHYTASDERRQIIREYKPFQTVFHQNHDLMAIDKIKEMRKKPVRTLEEAQALFLTSDIRLSRYNFEEEHKLSGTICEIVSDRLLTNILWLRNPHAKPSLKPIIAAHSRDLFVNRHVWDKFYDVLTDLTKSGKVREDDLSTLFWHSYIEDALRSVEDIESINEAFILENIEKAGEKQTSAFQTLEQQIKVLQTSGKAKEEDIKQKETELQKSKKELEEEKTRTKTIIESLPDKVKCDRDKEWLAKIQASKEEIRQKSERTANLAVNLLRIGLICICCILTIVANYFFNIQWQVTTSVFSFIGTGGILGLWKFGGKAKGKVFYFIYKRRTSSLEAIEG